MELEDESATAAAAGCVSGNGASLAAT